MKYGIHWFRRDLRVAGNDALKFNFKENNGKVVGLFVFDKEFLSRDDFSVNRFQFFLKSIQSLKTELQNIGSDLLVLDIGPEKAFADLLEELKDNKPSVITFSKDYEPFALNRDQKILKMFKGKDIEVHAFRDHLIIEPWELTKKNSEDEGYQVFTPFSRMWLDIFKTEKIQKRILKEEEAFKYLKTDKKKKIFSLKWSDLLKTTDHLDAYIKENGKKVTVDIPETGSKAVMKQLESFKQRLVDYKSKRDTPSEDVTSRFSMFLKNGSLTTSQIIYYLDLKPFNSKEKSQDVFFNELIWREFYYHILYRNSYVEKSSFKKDYDKLKWKNNKAWFEAWKDGKTGYPIVDAGMRELKTTGFMHNRLRMIVASFLVKDLLIDWRWGEKHFMHLLLDGDLAPNNGGWQWAASTGCDAQPYFRIFNPWTQSKKFDPDGFYIKKYIPELKDIEVKKLHSPIEGHKTYPKPIVDHAVQRKIALQLYKSTV